MPARPLKLYNGRWVHDGKSCTAYIAAYSREDACRVIAQATGSWPPGVRTELRVYWSEGLWGTTMAAYTPPTERCMYVVTDRHSRNPGVVRLPLGELPAEHKRKRKLAVVEVEDSIRQPTRREYLRDSEVSYWRSILLVTGGDIRETAKIAGVDRQHCYTRLRQLDINFKAYQPGDRQRIGRPRGSRREGSREWQELGE